MNRPLCTILIEAVQNTGLPISGVSGPVAAEGAASSLASWHQKGTDWFRVDWPSPPTAQRIVDADAIIQTADLSPKLRDRITPDEAQRLIDRRLTSQFTAAQVQEIEALAARADVDLVRKAKGQ